MILNPLFFSVFIMMGVMILVDKFTKKTPTIKMIQKVLRYLTLCLFVANFVVGFLSSHTYTYSSGWVTIYDAYKDDSDDVTLSLYREKLRKVGSSSHREQDLFTHINNKRTLGDDFVNLREKELLGDVSFTMNHSRNTKFVILYAENVRGQQVKVSDDVESIIQQNYIDRKSLLTSVQYRPYDKLEHSLFGIKISSDTPRFAGEVRLEFKSYVFDDE